MVRAVTACSPVCLSVCHSSVPTVMMASNHGFLLARNSVCSCSETQQIMQDGLIIRTVFSEFITLQQLVAGKRALCQKFPNFVQKNARNLDVSEFKYSLHSFHK